MKAVAISLLVLVLAFLINLVGIFVSPSYKMKIQETLGTRTKTETPAPATTDPTYKDEVAKLQETIEQLNAGLSAISRSGATQIPPISWNNKNTPATHSGNTLPVEKPKPKEFTLAIELQAKLMPDIFVKKTENKWIFDIKIYSNLDYTTYRDDKKKINIYAFADSYSIILANLKLASNVYTVKETDSFFETSFFLNPTNTKDTTIRFVTSIDGKAYGFEVSKTMYPKLKKLLTHK